MAKRKKRTTPEEQRAFDERTRLIEDYLARLRRRAEARRAETPEPGSS